MRRWQCSTQGERDETCVTVLVGETWDDVLKTDLQYIGYANVDLILLNQDSTLHLPVEEVRLSELKWIRIVFGR
jgi:hypothetical protein